MQEVVGSPVKVLLVDSSKLGVDKLYNQLLQIIGLGSFTGRIVPLALDVHAQRTKPSP